MIYTASYFQPEYHHGRLISISRTVPKDFEVADRLDFFVPHAALLRDWKAKIIDETAYIDRYRIQIKQSGGQIRSWLNGLDKHTDQTLLCWEKKGAFCHRNLVIKLIRHYRLDCYGGRDVAHINMPLLNSNQ